jgi:hypothetical protein
METEKPVWVDPELRTWFERNLVRYLKTPQLWDPDLAPIKRLVLVFGQPGCGMEAALQELITEHNVSAMEIFADGDAHVTKQELLSAQKTDRREDLLIIRKGHFFTYHQALFSLTHRLRITLGHFPFIIVISEEAPNVHKSAFWAQFTNSMIMVNVPPKEYNKRLLQYYFRRWQQHWGDRGGRIMLDEDDYDWLAVSCDYCLPRDIKLFVRRVFYHIIGRFPNETFDITRAVLEDQFMYNNHNLGILSITQRETRYDYTSMASEAGVGVIEGSTTTLADLERKRESKRARVDEGEGSGLSGDV